MPPLECPTADPPTAALVRDAFELRVRDGAETERRIALAEGKHTVGSGPRCSLRFQRPGVRPLHCLIVRDAGGLHVRRWADETQLNGAPFDEADLVPGDTLSVGSVELEIVGPAADERTVRATPSAQRGRDHHQAAQDQHTTYSTRVERRNGTSGQASDQTELVARKRRRKLLAAVRRQREEHNRLVERVGDLEQKIGCLLAVQQGLPRDDADATVLDREEESLPATERPLLADEVETEPSADWLTKTRAALARDRAPWGQAAHTPEPNETERLSTELSVAKELLADREAQLSELQKRIRNLEQQLLDSRRVMQCFADERSAWQKQLADVESRINGYLSRIQELEVQLLESHSAEAPQPETAVVGTAEPAIAASEPTETLGQTWPPLMDGEPTFDSNRPAAEQSAWDWQIDATEALAASPRLEAPPDDVDDSMPAGASEPPPPTEADVALARLRELSIWRDAPVEYEELSAVRQPEPVGDEALIVEEKEASPVEPDSPQSQSYIERYAHLFENDKAGDESTAAPDGMEASSPPPGEPAPASPDHEHEESIEEYMAKLMERLRGSSVADQAPQMDSVAVVDEHTSADASEGDDEEPNTLLDAEVPEPRPRAVAAELTTDMEALRALANQSARHAIGVHASRKMRRNVRTRFVVALLAGLTGLYFALRAPRWDSLEFVTAAVAVVASLYWGQLMLRALLSAVRVQALDKPKKDDFAAVGGRPSLPIDVRR